MRIEILQTGSHLTKYLNSSERKLPDYDLPSLIATMKRNNSGGNGELNTLILLKNPDEQIILAAMHEGTEIESFQSNDSVSFQIIEGKLKFHIQKDSFTLEKDQLMTFKEHIKYRLTSEEETIFLLTVSNDITQTANN
jgi:hypothetical protein